MEKIYSKLIFNNKHSKHYDEIDLVTFSPDGTQLAYRARINNKFVVVINEKDSKKYKEFGSYPHIDFVTFSSDSKKFAFKATILYNEHFIPISKNGKIEDEKINYYDDIEGLQYYSPEECFIYLAQLRNEIYLVKQK